MMHRGSLTKRAQKEVVCVATYLRVLRHTDKSPTKLTTSLKKEEEEEEESSFEDDFYC